MVSNAELHKLITSFQEEFKASNKVLNEKMDTFGERLDKVDHRLNKIEESKGTHAQKLEEIDDKIEEVDAKATESLTSVINRISEVEAQLQRVQIDDLPDCIHTKMTSWIFLNFPNLHFYPQNIQKRSPGLEILRAYQYS